MADMCQLKILEERKILVGFRYKGKAYSITGSDLIETFCKLADPEAKPEELADYGEKRDYNDYSIV